MKNISTISTIEGLNRSDQPVINCISDDVDDSYSNIYNVLKPNYGQRRILYQACNKEKDCERSHSLETLNVGNTLPKHRCRSFSLSE